MVDSLDASHIWRRSSIVARSPADVEGGKDSSGDESKPVWSVSGR